MIAVHPDTAGSFDILGICTIYNIDYTGMAQQLKEWASSLISANIYIDAGILYFVKKDYVMTVDCRRHIMDIFERMNA